MPTKIQRWGNSLGVRIPRAVAAEARVSAGSTVQIAVERGAVVVRPVRTRGYRLEDLLDRITDGNVHKEIATGPAIGREPW